MKYAHVCRGLLNTSKVQFLAKLYASVLQVYHLGLLWLSVHPSHHVVAEERESEEVGVDELVFADLGVH